MRNLLRDKFGAVVVLAVFAALGFFRFSPMDGDDLSASYVGCRVLASGNGSHLYAHDTVDFSDIGVDTVWASTAEQAPFDGTLHPYVQTPLWAFGLEPLCTRINFPQFKCVFAAIAMLSFAGSIGMIALYWAPRLLNPVGLAVVVTVLWFSIPFQYAMMLMQTHVLFFAMTIGALILAERHRPGWAGLLLAGAAAVKLTPGVLLVYWLLARRWGAAVSTIVWSVVLGGATWLAVGGGLMAAYLAELRRISHVLLLAMNSQSLAAWWMGWFHPADAVTQNTILILPVALRVVSVALMAGIAAVGGLIDHRHGVRPVGAMMGLIATTVFAPIAWTHYSIVLLAPLMMLWEENARKFGWAVWAIILLSYRPLAPDVIIWKIGRYALIRSEFYTYALCLGALAFAAWRRRVAEAIEPNSVEESADVRQLSAAA